MKKKTCTRCQKSKSLIEFHWKSKSKGIRHSYCKGCSSTIRREHYLSNKEEYKRRSRVSTKKIRQENEHKMITYLKEHPCVDCGESDPVVLQFDHVRGRKKNNVTTMTHSSYCWDTIKQEIQKCDVRCANCHIKKTAKRGNWMKRA